MEEELKKALEQGLKLAEKTGEFVIEQAPELLQQFYNWHLVENIIVFSVGLLMLIASIWSIRYGLKEYESEYQILGAFGILISLVCLIIGAMSTIKILVAPKIYLIEHFLK